MDEQSNEFVFYFDRIVHGFFVCLIYVLINLCLETGSFMK